MYKSSIFGQIFKLIDDKIISDAVERNESDRYSKSFGTKDQLRALVFGQLVNCRSIRDLEVRFNANPQLHYHWHASTLKRSTLSYVNKNRDYKVFQDVAHSLISSQNTNREVRKMLRVLDSSTITISGRGDEWTESTRIRTGKGLKVHIEYGVDSDNIEDANISATNVSDITVAQSFKIRSGQIYVFDKGYCNYNWWHKIDEQGAYFVTRLKGNAKYIVQEDRKIEHLQDPHVELDQLVALANKHPRGGKINLLAGKVLRLIVAVNPDDGKRYTFISNLLTVKASEIALYYKKRWSIELLFKWLKQNLKLTKFLGENENAIKTQIYAAIITYVLLGMFSRMCGNMFDRAIDLFSWIKINMISRNAVFMPPDPPMRRNHPTSNQLSMDFV